MAKNPSSLPKPKLKERNRGRLEPRPRHHDQPSSHSRRSFWMIASSEVVGNRGRTWRHLA